MSFDDFNNWVCPYGKCDGTGRVFDADRRNRIQCACWPDMIQALALTQMANIPPRYQGKGFDKGGTTIRERYPNYENVVNFAFAYAKKWRPAKDSGGWTRVFNGGRCLAILGQETTMGKTHLACAIMQQLIADYWTESVCHQDVCYFVQPVDWFGRISDHYRRYPVLPRGAASDEQSVDKGCEASRNALHEYEKRLKTTDLLVIDDLTRFKGGDEKRLDHIFRVVEHRVNNRKPTIITDNEPTMARVARNLGDNYGEPIVSRLESNGDILIIDVPAETRGRRKGS